MFRPAPMTRVDLLLLQRDLSLVLRTLAGGALLHLGRAETVSFGEEERRDRRQRAERCRALEERLDRMLKRLEVPAAPGGEGENVDLPLWENWAEKLDRHIRRLEEHRLRVLRLKERLERLLLFLRPLAGAELGWGDLGVLRHAVLRVGTVPAEALAPVGTGETVRIWSLGKAPGGLLIALLAPRSRTEEMEGALKDLSFSPIVLPRTLRGTFRESQDRTRALLTRCDRHLGVLQERWSRLREENGRELSRCRNAVALERHLLAAQENFGFTGRMAVLSGWVPKREMRRLERLLKGCCGDRFVLRRTEAGGDDTPVQLRNPAPLRPFQKMLAVYGTPLYGELEPTPLLAVGFLVLFGMMFGDVGQGAVLAACGIVLRRFSRYRQEGLIVAEVGVSAAFFGLLFGSVFGREDLFPPLWFSPMENIGLLMVAALLLGVALILSGLALRVVNGLREGDPWAVLTDRYGGAGLLFYGGAVALGFLVYRGSLPLGVLASLALPLTAVFLHPFVVHRGRIRGQTGFLMAEGMVEILETVLGYLANTFSFLRVAAFGLAHAGLFMALFALADAARQLPPGWFWAALVHVVGNVIMMALEGLVVSVQAVRLEFYEFFSKFFRGGGVEYRPLALESASKQGG